MDVLLISCRALPATPAEPHWTRRAAAAVAAALATRPEVERIRWLCPHTAEEGVPENPAARNTAAGEPVSGGSAAKVQLLPVPGAPGAFGDPQGRLCDAATDRELTLQMRAQLPDVVHCFGMGSPGSSALPWIADRMGRAALLSVRSAEVLCHRLDLQPFDRPGPCGTWDDPDRCVQCCRVPLDGPAVPRPGPEDPGEAQGRRRRAKEPRVTPLGFQNRLELTLGNLLPTASVLVAGETERDRLVTAGIPQARLRVVEDLTAVDLSLYGLPGD